MRGILHIVIMLAKKHRLTRAEFSKYFKTGKRTNSPIGTLIVSPNKSFHGAVVVGKKVSKKAVGRNVLRRRAYAQLYSKFKEEELKKLTPRVSYKEQELLILIPQISSMPAKLLKEPVGSLSHLRDEIIAALDFAIIGI